MILLCFSASSASWAWKPFQRSCITGFLLKNLIVCSLIVGEVKPYLKMEEQNCSPCFKPCKHRCLQLHSVDLRLFLLGLLMSIALSFFERNLLLPQDSQSRGSLSPGISKCYVTSMQNGDKVANLSRIRISCLETCFSPSYP